MEHQRSGSGRLIPSASGSSVVVESLLLRGGLAAVVAIVATQVASSELWVRAVLAVIAVAIVVCVLLAADKPSVAEQPGLAMPRTEPEHRTDPEGVADEAPWVDGLTSHVDESTSDHDSAPSLHDRFPGYTADAETLDPSVIELLQWTVGLSDDRTLRELSVLQRRITTVLALGRYELVHLDDTGADAPDLFESVGGGVAKSTMRELRPAVRRNGLVVAKGLADDGRAG